MLGASSAQMHATSLKATELAANTTLPPAEIAVLGRHAPLN